MNPWVAGARPRTLPAAVVPVAVGTAVAVGEGIVVWRLVAALIVALAIQVGTNFANDYQDGVRGTDDVRVGPVRLVASGLASASDVRTAALASFGVAAVFGLALAAVVGWELVLVGLLSFAAGWLYTGGPKPYGYLGLGEVFVFVFFGLVATVGSFYVQTSEVTALAVCAAVPVGLLATALLVVNNLRDIPTDTEAGKRTLAVRLGDRTTRIVYVTMLVDVFLLVIVLAVTARMPALLGLVGIVFAIPPIRRVRAGAKGPELIPVLGATGRAQLVTGLLLALGLALGG
ncbi:MAG TPA: 1,4-dihydroxy-2-naphthoate polyprenyltransferase [Acidimicrobiales bacterium]|nr:1,4-dihydroxy-2-naphthoate polyprenyltransferase [Acidimicrobiales bacterium]